MTGQDRFCKTAQAAIAHERTLFSPEAGNWRDLRTSITGATHSKPNGDYFMSALCPGAAGIGLARLSTVQQLVDDEVAQEIETALNTTLRCGFGGNHSLCHGDLGNIELLFGAGRFLNDLRCHSEAYCIAANVTEKVARNECLCATPSNVESPGLMTGMAGIGYGLLRLAQPTRVPSVLMLEAPLHA